MVSSSMAWVSWSAIVVSVSILNVGHPVADDRVDICLSLRMRWLLGRTCWKNLKYTEILVELGLSISWVSGEKASVVKDSFTSSASSLFGKQVIRMATFDRLGNNAEELKFGVTIPRIRIPVKTGRAIFRCYWGGSCQNYQRRNGLDATRLFEERLVKRRNKNETKTRCA